MDFEQLIQAGIWFGIIKVATIILFWAAITIAIIVILSKLIGMEISKQFNYDYLARKTAEENIRRQIIVEKNKSNQNDEDEIKH